MKLLSALLFFAIISICGEAEAAASPKPVGTPVEAAPGVKVFKAPITMGQVYEEDKVYKKLAGQTSAFGAADLFALKLAESTRLEGDDVGTCTTKLVEWREFHPFGPATSYQCLGEVIAYYKGDLVVQVRVDSDSGPMVGVGNFILVPVVRGKGGWQRRKVGSGVDMVAISNPNDDGNLDNFVPTFSSTHKLEQATLELEKRSRYEADSKSEFSVVGKDNLNTNGTGFGGWIYDRLLSAVPHFRQPLGGGEIRSIVRFIVPIFEGDTVRASSIFVEPSYYSILRSMTGQCLALAEFSYSPPKGASVASSTVVPIAASAGAGGAGAAAASAAAASAQSGLGPSLRSML